ncbi:MAG: hypothetical protein CTY33_06355 [Methylotenera sp.]|nr:MAG: hypothetical protein CTY33_06355 [Methylotenera sp.]
MAFLGSVIICSTARLVRGMHLQQQQQALAQGQQQWHAVEAYTLQQWLDAVLNRALLQAIIPSDALNFMRLSEVAEAYLWQQAISECLAKHEAAALFDIRAIANSAMEAHQLMYEWQVSEADISEYYLTQETRQFLRWQHTFLALCERQHAIDAVRLKAEQINLIETPGLTLPTHIQLAGFDRMTPLERRLFGILETRGVHIETIVLQHHASHVMQYALPDSHAECRAAVAWAKQKLAENPQAQLAIISPALGHIRRELADLLDDTFHPETLYPANYESPRCYDFSLGLALKEYALVQSALRLLKLASTKAQLRFDEVTPILQDAYWGNQDELDGRALLDASLRQNSNASYSLQHVIEQAGYLATKNIGLETLLTHLQVISHFQSTVHKRQLPSVWVAAFAELLDSIAWAKTRAFSSHEYQTQQSFQKRLVELNGLDALLGPISAADALQKLIELCNAAMFQPEAIGDTHIQLLGLLETPALKLDAIWVLNMNDQHWPPPVKLNPLLPAELQRQRGLPNACAQVQSTFATLVHARLLNSAPEIVFSYALKEEERELRPSPLLSNETASTLVTSELVPSLAETMAQPVVMELLDDSIAPEIAADETVRGGVKLFATQAICPAWAFYQYRLGARKLETPVDGLDNMARGSLLHKVLQYFWSDCRDSQTLKAMSPTACQHAIDSAIEGAIRALHEEISFQLPPQILKIEQQRLNALMQYWLSLEAERSDFVVEACEKQYLVELEGFNLSLTIDRIDRLTENANEGETANGGLVVIDYKTGSQVSHRSWADDRISEPQLPIYSALALQGEKVVAVCLAKIRSDESKFIGIADDEVLPGINVLSKSRAGSAFERFENWDSLRQHWHTSLTAIAREIKSGIASVTFAKESDLDYCDVKPLLRLPERLLQYESQHIALQSPVGESDSHAG